MGADCRPRFAALVSLVSLDRLDAWIAMVIIARELAVTGLRGVAA